MPLNPWSFMPPAARLMPFQQGFGLPQGGSPGMPGMPAMQGLAGPGAGLGGAAPAGPAPQAPMAPQAPRLPPGNRPMMMPGQIPGMPPQNPFQMASPLGGVPGGGGAGGGGAGGSGDLFGALRKVFASSTGESMSAPEVLRFFSPEQTSLKSFQPPAAPATPEQAVSSGSATPRDQVSWKRGVGLLVDGQPPHDPGR